MDFRIGDVVGHKKKNGIIGEITYIGLDIIHIKCPDDSRHFWNKHNVCLVHPSLIVPPYMLVPQS